MKCVTAMRFRYLIAFINLLILFQSINLPCIKSELNKNNRKISQTINFIENLRIKSSDNKQNYSFFAQGVEADTEGNIYVIDFTGVQILKFDKEGHFLRIIGGRGQGPARPVNRSRSRKHHVRRKTGRTQYRPHVSPNPSQ